MQAIKQIYKIGYGPSSSHTIAPYRIAKLYKKQFDCDEYTVKLCGSLAFTAKGHHTDFIISKALKTDNIKMLYDTNINENIMEITGFKEGKKYDTWHALSIGGGAIHIDEIVTEDEIEVYPHNSFKEIKNYIKENNLTLPEYAYHFEPDLKEYLLSCIKVMIEVVDKGINTEGLLNEPLKYYRNAKKLYTNSETTNDYLLAYSYAATEENAAGGKMVTAPTLGSCGVIISLVNFMYRNNKVEKEKIADMLAVAGIFGNLVKTNASIAGSVGGCQAEIGTATSMAASAIAYFNDADINTIEYAAEMGIEHYLGLTCDPVLGYVIIPCIERNAISILKAKECAYLALRLNIIEKDNVISFDSVVKTMNYTGKKIAVELKETSLGGLAQEYIND